MINITDKSKCTGCSACYNICANKAITMQSDFEGFSYPVVKLDKCVDCSLCEKVCPVLYKKENKNNEPEVYAAWNNDENIRINSTSGGVFSAIAVQFLSDGGFVVGAKYNQNFSIEHYIVSNVEDLPLLRQSKYAQSSLNSIFLQIKKLLNENKKVLFCGSPCQVAGLKSFLVKDYNNLLTVDFICRGIISQKVYMKYLESVCRHSGSKIKKVHFKNKDFGWNRFSTKLSLENGKTYHKDRYSDEYMVGYLKYNLYLRPCCHKCRFKSIPRVADLSLGDFWGIGNKSSELDDNKGTSVVLVNSNRGKRLFEKSSHMLYCTESNIEQVIKGNTCLFSSAPRGEFSDYFYKCFEKKDFIDLIHKIEKKDLWKNNKLSILDRLYLLKKSL